MSDDNEDSGPVETPWAFEIGQTVSVDGAGDGEVTWRRENANGARDYQVRTEAGDGWYAEALLKA